MTTPSLPSAMRFQSRFMQLAMAFLIVSASGLSGCLQSPTPPPPPPEEPSLPNGVFVTGPDGLAVDEPPLPLSFVFSDVGEEGAEPSIGITASGCIFFIAFKRFKIYVFFVSFRTNFRLAIQLCFKLCK